MYKRQIVFFEGDNEIEAIIDRDDFRQLDLDVKLTLTKFHQDEEESRLMRVMLTIERYLALPPFAMEKTRQIYVDQLKILGIENAEDRLPLPQDMMPQAPVAPDPSQSDIDELTPQEPVNEEEQVDDEAVQLIEETTTDENI